MDDAWYGHYQSPESKRYSGRSVRSVYIEMRDGVRLAADVWLPTKLGENDRLPTILHQTRYMRSVQLRFPLRRGPLKEPFDHTGLYRRRRNLFLRHGYAWLDVDVRGSGASFGEWIAPWGPDEIADGKDLVDWIIAQDWSNGIVGATGISYDGSCAEMLLVNRHAAVRAVAPRFSSFEPYTDIAYPGGVFQQPFMQEWNDLGKTLDRNAPWDIAGQHVRLAITGVSPVDEDRNGRLRKAASKDHRNNCDVYELVSRLTCRDSEVRDHPFYAEPEWRERLPGSPRRIDATYALLSASNYIDDINASGAAVYAYSGWFDLGYNHAAIKRFMNLDRAILLLGPWNHGGGYNCDPRRGPRKSRFDHDRELLRFFDHHLKGHANSLHDEAPVHYYTMVEERWKSATDWPPDCEERVLYLADPGALQTDPPSSESGSMKFVPDYTTGTGSWSRWKGGTEPNRKVHYGRRNLQDERMATFTAAPLQQDTEVTGHPLITLFITSSADDGYFFVYLEDVDEHGNSTYVTEGLLRAQHRRLSDDEPPYVHAVPFRSMSEDDLAPLRSGEVAELVFDLLPTSYLFVRGHRIRVAIGAADCDAFALLPGSPPQLGLECNKEHASRIMLPVIRRD